VHLCQNGAPAAICLCSGARLRRDRKRRFFTLLQDNLALPFETVNVFNEAISRVTVTAYEKVSTG
jgi:hypothetical protein